MFPRTPAKRFAQRALDALAPVRSFLLLEDDSDVDWEVDGEELTLHCHPHRRPLRGRFAARRPGQAQPSAQVCITPVRPAAQGMRGGGGRPQRDGART
jgi:hypothetical protein